jgi:lysyl-tRNA synthetase, class I
MSVTSHRNTTDWVARFAEDVVVEAQRRGAPVVCASGLSPSGPIHLGNLREIFTPHLVAEEIRARGIDCVHILSWDDYDRFRKVPAGIDPSWAVHIGKPLTSVPAPTGSRYPNWAEHFQAPMISALAQLSIDVVHISQTQNYTSGAYRDQILLAMKDRMRIDAILSRYRTKSQAPSASGLAESNDSSRAEDAAAQLLALEGSGAAFEDDGSRNRDYYPYKPYCSDCGRDTTFITTYDDETTELSYVCDCGKTETVTLAEYDHGKLVWKVDWPMRWSYEGVLFEPSGVDHSSPGSSFVVGRQITREVFEYDPPIGPMYAFVGISGMAKMSSSRGAVPTPADALEVLEAFLLRWLYVRRRPNQSFKVSFDQDIHRLYDEFDALTRRVKTGAATAVDVDTYVRSTSTTLGPLAMTPRPLPFGMLTSLVDITTGNDSQVLRILSELESEKPVLSLDEVRPRLTCAESWVKKYLPAEHRTWVSPAPQFEMGVGLTPSDREMLKVFLEGLDANWSLEGLTSLVYGVPKIQAGLPLDVQPTAELKAAQRAFFALIYRLLLGTRTGPRLPTLLLALGAERVRGLVGPLVIPD